MKVRKNTVKAKLIQYILDNGNDVIYTDMVRFVYEHNNPGRKYSRDHRGYYSCAFTSNGYWTSARNGLNSWRPKYRRDGCGFDNNLWRTDCSKASRTGYMFKGHEFIYKKPNGKYGAMRLGPNFRIKERKP